MKRDRPFVGLTRGSHRFELFRSSRRPTEKTHGRRYGAVIGPFRTVRAAQLMVDGGHGNPHTTCVADCERLARRQKETR